MTQKDDDTLTEPLWPLTEIEVRGLFGDEDSFTLALDLAATIFTGENGSGKSTILQAVSHVSHGRWRRFEQLPLAGLGLRFSDGTEVDVGRTDDGVILSSNRGDDWTPPQTSPAVRRTPQLARIRSELERAETAQERSMLRENYSRLLARYSEMEDVGPIETPSWVDAMDRAFNTKLISARRLEHHLRADEARSGEDRPQSVVDRYAEQLAERMRRHLSQYAGESRRQERSLPSEIVIAMQQSPLPDSETLAKQVDELGGEVRKLADSLTRVGLFQEEDPEQRFADYPRNNANILLAIREVYRVTKQRLEQLTALREELELFADFLGERLSNKRIELNPRDGIAVVLDRGHRIPPSSLSSGEQQLLALGYELLFGTEPHSVVLLDEPELSLHVAWLQGLLSSFMDIGATRQLQFVVATHSPSVLAGFSDRERSLDEFTS